jgi:hypothetical protein
VLGWRGLGVVIWVPYPLSQGYSPLSQGAARCGEAAKGGDLEISHHDKLRSNLE